MTQTVLSRSKRAQLEGQQFDHEAMRVGPFKVTDLRDAYTSRSTPDNLIRAKNYLTAVIDVSDVQDGSRTVEWLACLLCNQIRPSVAGIEAHISSDHANGPRRAGAGDVTELATAGDPVDSATAPAPAQRTPQEDAVEERVPQEPAGSKRDMRAFMEEARKTRKRWNDLQSQAKREGRPPLSKIEAAQRMGISRDTLRRRLEATEDSARKTYNQQSPQETRAAYEALIAERGEMTLVDAAEALGMHTTTLRKRLNETATAGGPAPVARPLTEDADGFPVPNPAFAAPAPAEDEDEDYVPATGVIDPVREASIDSTVELVTELHQSRAEWRQRALKAEERAETAERERDEAVAKLDGMREAVRSLGL